MPVAPGGEADRRARPDAAARRACDTKILGYDHNWSEHPNDIANTPPGEDPETEYPTDLLDSRAGALARRHRVPLLRRRPERADRAARRASRDKGIWFTECSGSHGPTDPPAQVFSDTLKWHARNLVLGVTRNWAQDRRQLEPRARPDRRPAQRRLRHLHRRGHRRPGDDRHPRTPSTTRSGTWRASSQPGARADRQHVVRHHRLERADHGRRVPQPATARPRSSSTTRTTTRARSPSRRAAQSFDYTLPGGALATFVWKAAARRRLPAARSAAAVRRRRSTTTPPRPGAAAI